MHSAKRVVVNTFISYGRMFLTMSASLFSTRILLNSLGSIDYGIFNLVAGIIAMLSFLNVAMATSTQRYLSYNQGSNDLIKQRNIFSNSFLLHLIIGLVVCFSLEIVGFFLFNGFLNIPLNRIETAKLVYHFMGGTVFFTIVSVPFIAIINAKENMLVIAIINIIESLLKLSIAIYLSASLFDRLSTYGVLIGLLSIVITTIYILFCFRNYDECTVHNLFKSDKELLKQLLSFAGWNLFGTVCFLGRTQGLAVLLNIFFGTIVNTAYGIANQVSSQMTLFSVTMMQSLNPQIMKSEGANDRERMLNLTMLASKFSFFLLAFIAVPCIIEMQSILTFWLKKIPENCIIFCDLILIASLVSQFTIGIQSGLQAIGDIKKYQFVVGLLILMNIPIAYGLLKIGFPSYSILISYIIIELIACIVRLYFIKKLGGLSLSTYFNKVILKIFFPFIILVFVSLLIRYSFEFNYRFFLTAFISSTIFFTSIYYVGLCDDEKSFVDFYLKDKLFKRKIKLTQE